MSRIKIIAFAISALVFFSCKAFCQEGNNDQNIKTIVGVVIKMDLDSGVINVKTGTVTKQLFSDADLDADLLWDELLKNSYIDADGLIQARYYELAKFSDLSLSRKFNSKKKLIYNIFQKVLSDNGITEVTISNDSILLQGTHHIASLEIERGDPVTVQYDSSLPDKNIVIHLVDNKPDDD